MKNLIIITALLFFTSCTRILIHANGYKTPRYESESRIKSFIKLHSLDESKIVFLKDSVKQKNALKLFSNSPGIIITDSSWNRLDFQNKKENCSAPVENLLRNICANYSNSIYYIDSNLIKFKSMVDYNMSSKNKAAASHYIFFLWNTSMGKNIKKIQDWEKILSGQVNCNYQTYWINCDFMADWYGVNPGKKIRYKVKRK